MLKDDFYQLKNIDQLSENEYDAIISLNNKHAIFQGHFPNKPIVPGVCMLQIVKEIVSSILDVELSLKSSRNIKFTALIDPDKVSDLRLNLVLNQEEGSNSLRVKNESFFGTTNAVKMDLNYVIQ